ncbi:MAG: SDR family NAD(P)-dependent oxidoreductase [Bacteroidales bacterium]|jgi:benzil reductase ((S)-benzoin forming)|nr:SDR family NAD(P)-dependent oxidoreductase [Bacteroidales bacterium]
MNVFITGTSSGIGNGLAQEFLSRGHAVWGVSRRDTSFDAPAGSYTHCNVDLTDFDAVQKLIAEFISDVSSFDLVILNAGVLGDIKLMSEVDVYEMKRVMEINVWSNKALLDILFDKVPRISQVVGMSTKSSLRSTPGWGSYSVSKAGLNMLMHVFATENPDTHFNAFAPGLVDSDIQEFIYNITDTEKYPAIKKLQDARYTDTMPDAERAAPMLIEKMKQALEFESGSFVDVRDM